MVIASHGQERIPGNHFVKPPLIALVYGNLGDAFLVQIFAAGRQMQFEGSVGGVLIRSRLGLRSVISCTGASTRSETRRKSTL